MAQPATRPEARDDDAPSLDPSAVERAYHRERARRHARHRRNNATRSSNARFWVVLAVLIFLTVVFALTAWREIQTTFGHLTAAVGDTRGWWPTRTDRVIVRRGEGRPLVIGHRGAAALAPENTIEALAAAVEAGADAVEFDVGCRGCCSVTTPSGRRGFTSTTRSRSCATRRSASRST